jgi:Pentapeptide repeats (8 copies)
LAALSLMLTPYTISDGTAGGRKMVSPERGQMFIAVWKTGFRLDLIGNYGGTFAYADLRGAQLAELKCEGLSFKMADFSGANLSHAEFKHCDFVNVTFKDALLNEAVFKAGSTNDAVARKNPPSFSECSFVIRRTSFRGQVHAFLGHGSFHQEDQRDQRQGEYAAHPEAIQVGQREGLLVSEVGH